MSVVTQTHIGCLVIRTTCGNLSKPLQREVEHHIEHCGVEWTCKRIKVYWNIALHLRNGDKDSAVLLCQSNSIAYHKATGLPKGPWGKVIERFVNAQKPSVIRRYAAVLRFYTSLKLDEMSDAQKQKAISSISNPRRLYNGVWEGHGEKSDLYERLRNQLNECFKAILHQIGYKGRRPLSTDEIHADKLHACSYYYSDVQCPKGLRNVPYARLTLSCITTTYCPPSLDYQTPCQETRQGYLALGLKEHYFARVQCLQEQGCKARVVFQPNTWTQLAFMPLHNRLASFNRHYFRNVSCVEDQTAGAYAAMYRIGEGHDVYSVDLSSATDRFPREVSEDFLRQLGYSEYADALEEVCSHPHKCDFSPSGEITYSVGQPMGLYGSFPLFHLSNIVVCSLAERTAAECCGGMVEPFFKNGPTFFVLGDDVIFSDSNVAYYYKEIMNGLGVDISTHKSFQGKVAEFAGFVCVPLRNGGVTCFRPYKVPNGDTITNPMEFLHSMGSKVSSIKPWWERQFRAYEATLSQRDVALSPIVTDDHPMMSSVYRGDNHWLISLTNQLYEYDEIRSFTPHPGTNTKINRIPMFHERRMFDHYGYNESRLRQAEREERIAFRTIPARLKTDPLMRSFFQEQKEKEVSPPAPDPALGNTPVEQAKVSISGPKGNDTPNQDVTSSQTSQSRRIGRSR